MTKESNRDPSRRERDPGEAGPSGVAGTSGVKAAVARKVPIESESSSEEDVSFQPPADPVGEMSTTEARSDAAAHGDESTERVPSSDRSPPSSGTEQEIRSRVTARPKKNKEEAARAKRARHEHKRKRKQATNEAESRHKHKKHKQDTSQGGLAPSNEAESRHKHKKHKRKHKLKQDTSQGGLAPTNEAESSLKEPSLSAPVEDEEQEEPTIGDGLESRFEQEMRENTLHTELEKDNACAAHGKTAAVETTPAEVQAAREPSPGTEEPIGGSPPSSATEKEAKKEIGKKGYSLKIFPTDGHFSNTTTLFLFQLGFRVSWPKIKQQSTQLVVMNQSTQNHQVLPLSLSGHLLQRQVLPLLKGQPVTIHLHRLKPNKMSGRQ